MDFPNDITDQSHQILVDVEATMATLSKLDADGFEERYLLYLGALDISPKVVNKGNTRVYSTEFASLTVDNYPNTDNSVGLLVPVPSGNSTSLNLVLMYIGTVIKDHDGEKFIDALNFVLEKKGQKIIEMGGFAIKISKREKKQNVCPMVAIEIKKTPGNGHVCFRQNKSKLFRDRI